MRSIFLTIILGFVSLLIHSQNIQIKGNVVDASGAPLPGVNILVKNTNLGGTTDFDGNFAIANIPVGAVLQISYVGFTTKVVKLTNSNFLKIQLQEDSQALEEVVIIGYGTQKKSVVTGAISSVKASDLESLPVERVEQALQGRVSGVVIASNSGQPGSSSTVRVRGITTFDTYGGNNPLWVIDGIIINADGIGFLNQSDIESIEVLKDAASLAIYGARAASGVIMVTTKKGKQGKMQVTYNGFTGVSGAAKKLSLLNATEYGAIMNEKSVASGGPILYPNLSLLGVGTDWQSIIFNDSALRNSHELSLTTANEVSSFYASVGFSDQEGIVTSDISKFDKKSFRLNSTHKLSKYITVGQTFGYTHKKSIGVESNAEFSGPMISAINLDPITKVVITDPVVANSSPYNSFPVMRDAFGNPYGISSIVGQEMVNPLALVKTRLGNYGWSDDFVGNAFLEVKPIEGLILKSSIGGNLAYWGDEGFTPVFYLSATNSNSKNNLFRGRHKGFGWNMENTIAYTKEIGKHNLSLLLGQGAYVDGIVSGTFVSYQDIPVDNRDDATFNWNVPANQKIGGAYEGNEHRVTSIFSRLTYNYDERYLFTGIVRRDGSSRFGLNNRYGIFPSFSLGWNAFKETFWPQNNIIDQLKIRGGWGVTGNDAIPDFGYLALIGGGRDYTFGPSGSPVTIGYSPNAPDNPDLKWEETTQFNVGFETKLFNNVNVTFDYFRKLTSGILQYNEIPGYLGSAGLPLGNVADMENSGFEIELGYRKQLGEVNFKMNGNISYLKNEVTNLGSGKEFLSGGVAFQGMGPVTRTQIGQPYNSFYGFKTDGIFQNLTELNAYVNDLGNPIQPNAGLGDFKWVDLNEDGVINAEDKTFLGSPLPKLTFGLTMNMDYKGFDFMVFMQGATGNKIFQGLRRLDINTANYQTKVLSRWTGEGTSNDYPRLTNNDANGNFTNVSDFYLEKGDYLRFKTIQFGYTVDSNILSSIGAEKVRLYVTGENLLTLTKYTGFDPEIGGNVLGIDKGFYPQARSFMLGVNLMF